MYNWIRSLCGIIVTVTEVCVNEYVSLFYRQGSQAMYSAQQSDQFTGGLAAAVQTKNVGSVRS